MAREYRPFVGVPIAHLAAVLAHVEQRAPDPDPLERALDAEQCGRYRDELVRRERESRVPQQEIAA